MAIQAKNLKLFIMFVLIISGLSESQMTRPGCQESCGNVKIPFPFGIKENCYLSSEFQITCDDTFFPPKPFWSVTSKRHHTEVLNISIDDAQIRVLTIIASQCYTLMPNGTRSNLSGPNLTTSWVNPTIPFFPFSHTRNRFFGVGCNNDARIFGMNLELGCASTCSLNRSSLVDGVCLGRGCCQIPLPKGLRSFTVSVGHYSNTTLTDFNPCSYSFVAADDFYNFSIVDLRNNDFRVTNLVPSILDWSVGLQKCEDVQNSSSYVCASNSVCSDSDEAPGYLCHCSPGYRGNPYLPNGCPDIDECQESSDDCAENNSDCVNTNGSYTCSCKKGYNGDGRQNGERCADIGSSHNSLAINVAVGVGASLVVVIIGSILFWVLRKRKLIKLKEKFFEQNGGFLLQQLVEQKELTSHMIKIFTAEELQSSTKNYDDSLIAGRGGYGTVYKGTLLDGTVVAIKKSKQTDIDIDEDQVKQFISEVVILCQVNNRNIVRMLGCCLETPSPILVYEFMSNGTLFEHLHNKERKTLSWGARLKIATKTAGVLSYLHSQAVTPIIHRDIKSTNILLDENFNPRVSDFGASKLIATEEMQVCTMVQGTLGYLDPEYLQTSQLTEKSDVYSFGVVLVELLTGQKAIIFNKPEAERSLAKYFLSALQEKRLVEVLEPRVVEEGSVELLQEVAEIARYCLSLKGDERPSMKQVAMELEGLRSMGVGRHFSPWNDEELHSEEETVYLLGDTVENYDSIEKQVVITIAADAR